MKQPGKKLTKAEIMKEAKEIGIDPDQSYEELREEIDIFVCKQCNKEHFGHYPRDDNEFCSDTCEAEYINEHYK